MTADEQVSPEGMALSEECKRQRFNRRGRSKAKKGQRCSSGFDCKNKKGTAKVPYIISFYLEEEIQLWYNWYGNHSIWRWAGTAQAAVPAIVLLSENTAGKDNTADFHSDKSLRTICIVRGRLLSEISDRSD